MRGRLNSGTLAALALGVLLLGTGVARTASAFEWDLPGERKFSIHGFYETRLLFVGSELPINGATWSSFRHVLSTELELTLFPDGFGPFDSMFMFSRFLVSYDCIYTYSCGTFNSADSYGDYKRKAVRQPLSLREDTKNNPGYFAGLLQNVYRPGSLQGPSEVLNPARRYRDCDNPPGVFANPFPLAAFCNLNSRSPLDNPNNQTGNKFWEVRAGTFHPFTRPSLLAAARRQIGDAEYDRLQGLLVSGQVLSRSDTAFRLALLAEAQEADERGDPDLAEALTLQADAILGDTDTTFDANIPALLATRPDPNRFAQYANAFAPQLLTAKYGSSRLRNLVWPFLATINTPIAPGGYFTAGAGAGGSGGGLDTISQYDQALGETLTRPLGGLPIAQVDPGVLLFSDANAQNRVNPFFVGPDGIRDSVDDLPFVTNNPVAIDAGYTIETPLQGATEAAFDGTFRPGPSGTPSFAIYSEAARITVPTVNDPGATKVVELYGVYSDRFLTSNGCGNITSPSRFGDYNPVTGTCTRGGVDVTAEALARGCGVRERSAQTLNIGVNGDGQCIEINTSSPASGSQLQFEVLDLLGDLNARPLQANIEPLAATDFRAFADGGANNTLPARPRLQGNGISQQSPGARREYEQYHNLVSNLDLKYSVDSLQWNHGASQREHEFMEGYLEFEMADSQVYARLGKLIVVWGKTELFRNQDRNNPLDIGNGIFAPLEEQRVGQWALDMTFSPEAFMRVGPVEDLRLEFLTIFNPFEPTDLGKCGEGSAVDIICLKSFGAIANGLAGLGVIGEHRPYNDYAGIERWDFGARIEGRFDRFTFAISDFWGWDDGFYLDLVQQYERTADVTTGAPLSVGSRGNTTGCTVRTNAAGAAVGPNNIAGDGDDAFPSTGNCLLWDPPETPDAAQHLRATEAVANLQNVNQTLFHSICAYTFDADEGFCAFDRLNYPLEFGLISNIISGLGVLGSIVTDGVESIQVQDPGGHTSVTQRGSNVVLARGFLPIEPLALQSPDFQDLGLSMTSGQASLLGCGAAYASPCSAAQQAAWNSDPVISGDLTRDPRLGPAQVGGIDLLNADASVVTQEFVGLKALSPGALVGSRLDNAGLLYYQNGVNFSRDGQQDADIDADFYRQGMEISPVSGVASFETSGEYLDLTPADVIDLGEEGRARYQIQPGNILEADGWIEPMPWTVNQEILERYGAIVFNTDPNNVLDLDSPLNKWNLIDPNQDPNDIANIDYSDIDGEYCARWMNGSDELVATPFNLGCSALETVSANFERLLISLEIIGFDRVFDAPESLQELAFWSESNTDRQAAGDAIAGSDGIYERNQFVVSDEQMDFNVVPAVVTGAEDFALVAVTPTGAETVQAATARTLLEFDPETECELSYCYLNVENVLIDPDDSLPVQGRTRVLAMPVGLTVDSGTRDPSDPNQLVVTGTYKVNPAGLQYLQETGDDPRLRRLLASQVIEVENATGETVLVQMNAAQVAELLGQLGSQTARGRDLDADQSADLDRNRDAIWDGQDDYTGGGPITDDNILCGSGIPGDPLQDGVQYSPYRRDQDQNSEAFRALFPNGLPPRSPVFCRGVSGILGATNQTLPVRRAGGDGRYGRRDFLWQGGRQVAFNYQKRNVFGFGLDFAEDTTKTSWGVEFSWMANRLIPNNTEYSGLSQSDELVLSVSVDRPTFFNYLNPNRSFFMNLQMFLRYLPDYEGGRGNFDGNYGFAGASVSGNVAFTFFTGYFQDRLAPRVTILYAPWESQGALITGLSYRWNDAFSTSLGWTQFFGHVYKQQGAYFPIAQYGSVADYTSPVLRGVAPVLYRDQAEVRIRYTW